MAFVVFFTDSKGTPAYRRVDTREDAVATVEHLRNDLEVTDAEIHRLSPVPLTFKTYYRVEVPDDGTQEQAPARAEVPASPVQEDVAEPAVAALPVAALPAADLPAPARPAPALPVPSPSIPFNDDGAGFGSVPGLVPFGDDDAIPLPRDTSTGEEYGAVPGLLPEEPSLGYFAS